MKRFFHTTLLIASCFISILLKAQDDPKKLPFWDYHLSFDQRIDDLVGRLTLEEKVAQMLNATPAIPRLGIPAYDWWNEVLHGVARTPYKVTVYPQAIAMAATFDSNSIYTMADYSALEGRAIHNKAIAQGRTGDRYLGLTYWTPNINIFRDPRWGRGQETYGEDPFLTSMMAKAFVRGLQGDDPKYLKAAACAKHFAVHSGPEPIRHSFDVDVSNYDLWNTYLPAFKELIVNAKVAGVMCAYNAFRKQPCCGSDILMNDILRNQWKFTGYVTSDCGAIDDFFRFHKTHPDAASAATDAVMHGTDVDCGNVAYKALVSAVKSGNITEKQIDVSLKRLFMIRFRLGMFDPVSLVKYAQTPASALEDPAHLKHSLKMAQQSIVLLRNEKNTLPLKKDLKKIAIIGPNADNAIAVLGNYNGTPSNVVTALAGIQKKVGDKTKIVYEKGINFTNDTLLVYRNIEQLCNWQGKKGFQATYFNNKELKGEPVITRIETKVDHFWQEGEELATGLPATNVSARYTTQFTAEKDGDINFELEADDGYRFYIDSVLTIDAWSRNRWGARTAKLNTKKGQTYLLTLEYWQGEGKASVKLNAGDFAATDFKALAARVKDADAIIFVGGISPQLEGEEMKVPFPGFNGGDRTTIQLPAVQTALMKELKATGKPVVFVMMTGSALAIPWEAENVPAIMNTWYGGQFAGDAIADVLFGDYNPSGRLPITFYKSDADLGSFTDYSMENRTYRYFRGKALYSFGFGLSYSNYKYQLVKMTKSGNRYLFNVKITNTGKMAGEEVAQLYLSTGNAQTKSPVRQLKGFKRVSLGAGESKNISFELSAEDLAEFDEKGNRLVPKGKYEVTIGGGQPGQEKTSSNIVRSELVVK